MNVNEISAMANKLSIPQLQQALRDGSLPPYVGIPLLQQKVKMQQAAKNAQGAGQPKPPTVAEQIEGEAQQASMEDMMRKRALAMQAEMGQTGGISDFLKKPEAMAKGGAVAFSEGREVPDIGAIYEKMANGVPLTADELKIVSGQTKLTTNARYPWLGQTPYGAPAPQRNAVAQPSTGYVLNPSYELPTALPPLAQGYSPDVNMMSNMVRESQRAVPSGAPEPDMQRLTNELLKDRPNYVGVNTLPTGDITSTKPSAADNKQRYRTVLPSEDITTVKPTKEPYVSEPMPEMHALTKRLLEEKPKGVDIPAYTPTNVPDNDIPLQAQPAVRGIAPLAPGMAENLNILNQQAAQAADQRSMAERMQLRQEPTASKPPVVNQNATPYGAAIAAQQPQGANPAQAAAQSIVQDAIPARGRAYSDYVNDLKGAIGENKSAQDFKDYLEQQGKEYSEAKGKAPWMALMQAGLATMAGTSPFALANIGAGGIQGLKAYTEDMKDLRKEQDKAKELQLKMSQAQREEDVAIAKFGMQSKQADDIQAKQERIADKQIASHEKIATMQDQTAKEGHAITQAAYGRPTEASMAYELANVTTALRNAKTPEEKAALENKLEGLKAGLSSMNSYGGGNAFKTGVELRAFAEDSQKRLDEYLKGLGFMEKQPSSLAKDSTYKRLVAERDEATRAHKQYIANNSNLLGGNTITPPPVGGVSSGGDGWGKVQVN